MTYEIYLIEEDEESIAHYGTKGMKWGVRRADDSSGGVSKTSPSVNSADRGMSKQQAVAAGKAAFAVGKYGIVPLSAATGVGIPVAMGLGVSMKIMSDPDVQKAVSAAAAYSATIMKDVGQTSMDVLKKIDNPFSVKTTTRTIEVDRYGKVIKPKKVSKENQDWLDKLNLPEVRKHDGMFNPDAKLDTSYVRDDK